MVNEYQKNTSENISTHCETQATALLNKRERRFPSNLIDFYIIILCLFNFETIQCVQFAKLLYLF